MITFFLKYWATPAVAVYEFKKDFFSLPVSQCHVLINYPFVFYLFLLISLRFCDTRVENYHKSEKCHTHN